MLDVSLIIEHLRNKAFRPTLTNCAITFSFVQMDGNDFKRYFVDIMHLLKLCIYNHRAEGKNLASYVTCVESKKKKKKKKYTHTQISMIFLFYIKRTVLYVSLLKYISVLLSK